MNKREIEAQIKYVGENICNFSGSHVHRQMTKVVNELVDNGYILPLKDVFAKNKFKSKKWILTNKSLKLAKDTDSQGNKATSKKISLPTQVITPNQKADITQKETAQKQAHVPTLAEQRRQLEEAIKD